MIPKIIHYVWVGDKPKSDLILKCIKSWKTHCPDYKIMEWNNTSLKEITNQYAIQAFEHKKWAFVSDYLRLYALKTYGGIYCDTDLEITQNIDKFLENDFFTGYEKYDGNYAPITALMGAQKNNKIIESLIEEYENLSFIENGKMNQTTNTKRISSYFTKEFNLNTPYDGSQTTELSKKVHIYPSYFFCTPENNKENYSIHHFNGSWLDPYIRKNLFSIFGYKIVRFKKKPKIEGDYLPMANNEKKLFEFDLTSKKKICLIKEYNK